MTRRGAVHAARVAVTTGAARWAVRTALAGPLVGLAWWLVAPVEAVGVVQLSDGRLLAHAPEHPELEAAQDGVLVLLSVGAGLVTGLAVSLRQTRSPTAATVLAVAGSLVGTGLALLTGFLLGPATLVDQGAPGSGGAAGGAGGPGGADFMSPLLLGAPGVALVWPTVAALVATTGHLARCWVEPEVRGSPPPSAPPPSPLSPPAPPLSPPAPPPSPPASSPPPP